MRDFVDDGTTALLGMESEDGVQRPIASDP